jgi:hypothetical protein
MGKIGTGSSQILPKRKMPHFIAITKCHGTDFSISQPLFEIAVVPVTEIKLIF